MMVSLAKGIELQKTGQSRRRCTDGEVAIGKAQTRAFTPTHQASSSPSPRHHALHLDPCSVAEE